jgi:hypothetical protein
MVDGKQGLETRLASFNCCVPVGPPCTASHDHRTGSHLIKSSNYPRLAATSRMIAAE